MAAIDRSIWGPLAAAARQRGYLEAKRPDPATNLLVAVDHEGHRHILLQVGTPQDWFADDRSRGLSVTGRNLELEGRPLLPFLDVTCTDTNGHDAFDLVAGEILSRLNAGEAPSGAVSATLAHWRRFWANALLGALSAQQVRGLFGELWFLIVWLLPRGNRNVRHWMGPTGARHDFQWSSGAVECKATLSTRGHVHHINGLDQLLRPDSGPLHVFSLRLREEPAAANSLISLIQRAHTLLEPDPENHNLFEQRLEALGYSPSHDALYEQMRFRVVEERLYRVDTGFPQLTPASFVGGLPSGIEGVEYVINLETCPQLIVSRSPAEPGITLVPEP